MRVAAVGECMIELSAHGAGAWRMGFAGDTFNTLWTLRALLPTSDPCDYVSAFGDDPFSADQIDFLSRSGIGIGESPRLAGARPGLYAIALDGAERSFTYWRSDAAARRLADDVDALEKSLADRRLVYFSGITLAILEAASRRRLLEALAAARRQGATTAFDPNYRPRLWRDADAAKEAFAAAFAVTDIALPTFSDEQLLWGDGSPAQTALRMSEAGVRETAVKNGSEPALLVTDGATEAVPAEPVLRPIDTTGAGDAFNGGYLAARLLRTSPVEAVVRGHRTAAATVCVRGALAPVETLRSAFEGEAPPA